MSREDEGGCKLSSVYKHKERKPKKPHYIPRPWGKPYNYKCFQCPFTCMEKSHLYNHMKYSLCKNSLSLLIESDWPYKKGNLLHPELHLLQATEAVRHRSHQSEGLDTNNSDACVGEQPPNLVLRQDDKAEAMTDDGSQEDLHQFPEDEEEEDEEEEEEEETERKKEIDQRKKKEEIAAVAVHDITVRPDLNAMLLGLKNRRGKPYKDAEPDFVITDVYSLKNEMNKSKELSPIESEIKPKQCKIPLKCHRNEDILIEQWKLQGNGPKRGTEEVQPQGPEPSSMPCYPPPAYSEYHEHQGLNLSLLGINYPVSPNLFSYLAPTMANSVSSHSHLAQLPFLASTAQLMHPHSTHFQPVQSQERSTFLPRFYYPLLFEHSFGASDGKMAANKAELQQATGSSVMAQMRPSMEVQKDGPRKMHTVNSSIPWTSTTRERPLPPDLSHKHPVTQEEEEKWTEDRNRPHQAIKSLTQRASSVVYNNTMIGLRDGGSLPSRLCKSELTKGACLQTTALTASSLKRKSSCGTGTTDILRDLSAPENQGNCKFSLQGSAQPLTTVDRHWLTEHDTPHVKTPDSETLVSRSMSDSQPHCKRKHLQEAPTKAGDVEMATMLIGDLSKTLEEYQEVEKKLSDMTKKDNPGQKELREQLVKIRCELHHVQQALEKASKPHEGPLDLSMKRSVDAQDQTEHASKEAYRETLGSSISLQCQEHASNHRSLSPTEDVEDTDTGLYPSDSDNQAIEMMIKMSRSESLRPASDIHSSPPIKAEALPPELRHALEPYYNRTTKCEADSSVLLSTDGRASQVSQVPQQPLTQEECKLAARFTQHVQSCGGASGEVEIICVHSPLSTV